MPTYEFQCQKCSSVYEEVRSFARADEPSRCPECHSPRVKRVLSPVYAYSPGSSLAVGGGCACSSGGTCGCKSTSTRT